MASTYSTNLKIELIGTGEQSGTWGSTTNTNLGTALEEAIVGQATANFATDADLTLTLTNDNSTQVARAFVLNATGTISATRNLIVPTINKPYIVRNNTTGGQSITVKTSAGTGVTVANGTSAFLYTDGTNVVNAFTYGTGAGDVTLNGTQTLTNKTIDYASNTLTGVVAATSGIASGLTLNDGYTEEVFALGTTGSIALSPANGSIQTCALTGNPTFTDSLSAGQSIVLMLTNGSSYTVTWPTVTWVKAGGSAAPTLTANDVLVFWKVSTTLYGAYVGSGV